MSILKVCTTDYLKSTTRGVEYSELHFYARLLDSFLTATKQDDAVQHVPDPLPVIQGRLNYTNANAVPVKLILEIRRASRAMLVGNTNMIRLRDSVSWDFGTTAEAIPPSFSTDYGAAALRTKKTPFSFKSATEYYVGISWWGASYNLVDLGTIPAGHTSDIQYECLLDTPNEFRPWDNGKAQEKFGVKARYAQLLLWGMRT